MIDGDEWEDIVDDDNYIPNIPFSTFSKIPIQKLQETSLNLYFIQLFFTDELINVIIKDTCAYATEKNSTNHKLPKRSIWNT